MPQQCQLKSLAKYRRHQKPRDNILGVTCPAIRRLARRGGVYRIKKEIYDDTRVVLKERLTEVSYRPDFQHSGLEYLARAI
ncbi:hypothetical protein BJX76DRAFT_356529 [Aspergillus varians]